MPAIIDNIRKSSTSNSSSESSRDELNKNDATNPLKVDGDYTETVDFDIPEEKLDNFEEKFEALFDSSFNAKEGKKIDQDNDKKEDSSRSSSSSSSESSISDQENNKIVITSPKGKN